MNRLFCNNFIIILFAFLFLSIAAISQAAPGDCSQIDILCVDDTLGSTQEYSNIQLAVNDAQPGDTVLVYSGTYSETITTQRSGTNGNRITIKANSNVLVNGRFTINHGYITVDGFEITGFGSGKGFTTNSNANYCEILNNDIHDFAGGRAIEMPRSTGVPSNPTGCLIKGNWIHGQANANLYIIFGGTNHIVEDNEMGPGVVAGDALRPFGDNHIIRNNYIHDITSGGGHTDVFQIFNDNNWRMRNLIFEKNTIKNWDGQAWMVDVTSDSDIIIIRNNVFDNVRSAGQSYSPHTMVYNNVFANSGYGNGRAVMIRSAPGRGSGANSEVKNNIFYNSGSTSNNGWYSVDSGAQSTFEGDYNAIYPTKNGFGETHGINGQDTMFVNTNISNFRLQSVSPAINAGTTLTGFSDDKDGNTRSGVWDMGAYEYTGNVDIIPPAAPTNLKAQ